MEPDFYEVDVPWGVRPGEDVPRAEEAVVGRFDEAKHLRDKSGRWARMGSGVDLDSPRARAAQRRIGKPQTEEQKQRVAGILREQAQGYVASGLPGYQAEMREETAAGKRGPRPRQDDFASAAGQHEREIRQAARNPRLPGGSYDLDAAAENVLNRQVAADAATRLAAFEQFQRTLRGKRG